MPVTAPTIWLTGDAAAGTATASATLFGGAVNGGVSASRCAGTTEAHNQFAMAYAGTLTNFSSNVSSNGRTTNSVYGVNNNGASIFATTYTSGQTGQKTDLSSVSVAVDDLLSGYLTTSTGAGTIVNACNAMQFTATSGTVWTLGGNTQNGGAGNANNGDRFIQISGELSAGGLITTEANADLKVPLAFTGTYFQSYVNANSRNSTSSLVVLRKNDTTDMATLTYTASQTGFKKDTNTYSYAATDLMAVRVNLGVDSGTFTFSTWGLCAISTTDGQSMWGAGRPQGMSLAAGSTSQFTFCGRLANQTEAQAQAALQSVGTASKLGVHVTTMGSTTNPTFKFRKGAANGNETATITGANAWFEDASNSDTWNATDLLNTQLTNITVAAIIITGVVALVTTATSGGGATSPGGTLPMMGVG